MYDGIVFDFDGVIADSMPPQERCWRASVRDVIGDAREQIETQIVENLYKGFAGEQMFRSIDLSFEQKKNLRVTKDEMWNEIRNSTPLMAGANEALKRLSRRYSLFIATTANRQYVDAVLAREALESVFAIVLTNADVPKPKPHPDMLNRIMSDSGIVKARILMVGDSESDLQMAKNADISFMPFGAGWSSKIAAEMNGAANWQELGHRLLAAED